MLRRVAQAVALRTAGIAIAITLGGCADWPGLVAGSATGFENVPPGYYWAEYDHETLMLFRMPQARPDPGQWYEQKGAVPDWFTGPGLYLLHENLAWEPVAQEGSQTLDLWLQLWDVGPAPDTLEPEVDP